MSIRLGSPREIGRRYGGYELQEALGAGGMGEVYRASAPDGRPVAIKLLTKTGSTKASRRFLREIEIARNTQHPNLISVEAFGSEPDGRIWYAMEFLEGRSIHEELSLQGPMKPDRVAARLRDIASGLDALHRAKVVHRDLKPANIMLVGEERESAKILDFGVAHVGGAEGEELTQLTRTGAFLGTPIFMAPEQLAGETATPACDVYSLGVIAYAMLTGRSPWQASGAKLLVERLSVREPPALPPCGGLEGVVGAMLVFEADGRPRHARAVLDLLERLEGAKTEQGRRAPTKVIERAPPRATNEAPLNSRSSSTTPVILGAPEAPPRIPVERSARFLRLLAMGAGVVLMGSTATGLFLMRTRPTEAVTVEYVERVAPPPAPPPAPPSLPPITSKPAEVTPNNTAADPPLERAHPPPRPEPSSPPRKEKSFEELDRALEAQLMAKGLLPEDLPKLSAEFGEAWMSWREGGARDADFRLIHDKLRVAIEGEGASRAVLEAKLDRVLTRLRASAGSDPSASERQAAYLALREQLSRSPAGSKSNELARAISRLEVSLPK
ncbi:MAG: serine/threonine protein kinase [Deltaproteobacteria bacterium]|nr:serine/threonine protein kinase [Deltaproteobacteria bacterium]